MRIIGMLRVKDEARWIARALASIKPLCERIYVMDDSSTDGTYELCLAIPGVMPWRSPFTDLNEARDKSWLLDGVIQIDRPDWIVAIDGDELLTPESIPAIRAALGTDKRCMSFKVRYLWDREDQVRVDRVYGQFARQSMFRPGLERFEGKPPGFHCSNVPKALHSSCAYPAATLLHLGYLHREDRIRKWKWYNEHDPDNDVEQRYSHVVQGDVPEIPAEAVLMHAGPLELRPLSEVL